MKSPFLFVVSCISVVVVGGVHAKAEIRPRSLSELRESELVVVGTIMRINIVTERAEIERGFGNYDWGIYLTLAIESVEQGQLSHAEVEFRCFRIKSRRSSMEYLTPSGHRPIPARGTRVRVHLNRENSRWAAVLPNGITPTDANDDQSVIPDGRLTEASEVRELRSLTYTYLLPLDVWMIIVVVVFIAILATIFLRRRAMNDNISN